ncbi:hypothetical protein B0H14DRAFT_3423705 [Mycena olivaceomarginata]|nr:hypothetical protein B0H14DRAFT_3423705 [Mycena olivaceomarginata]
MVNDPGRQLFQDQIQTHGFLFLNDYLDNILAGPSPLIELVKTPGRKKATSKRPVAACLRLEDCYLVSGGITFSRSFDFLLMSFRMIMILVQKKTVVPVNGFHRALLQAMDKSPPPPPHESHVREVPLKAKEKALQPRENHAADYLVSSGAKDKSPTPPAEPHPCSWLF